MASYIHAVEMSSTPERAIPGAQRVMGVVPGGGHLIHMAGHIWMLMGEYELMASPTSGLSWLIVST